MSPERLNFRPAVNGDLDALFRLDTVCFSSAFRFSRAAMQRYVADRNSITTIAEWGDHLAGFSIIQIKEAANGKLAYLVTLDVAPAYRRMGVARGLLENAIRQARNYSCDFIDLHVWVENIAAVTFYEAVSFVRRETIPHFYGGNLNAHHYQKPLVT